jgi:hypothetical protein
MVRQNAPVSSERGDVETDFDQIMDRGGTNAIATDSFRQFLFDGDDVVLPIAMRSRCGSPTCHSRQPQLRSTRCANGLSVRSSATPCLRTSNCSTPSAPGVAPALFDLVEYILEPDEKVLTLSAAYAPFEMSATRLERQLVTSGLLESNGGRYSVDFADLNEKLADPKVRMFFLCHPHNPTGRIWDQDELRRIASLCFANDVLVVSDEIHCDLLRSGRTHTPLAKLFPDSDQIITCMSSSKTFNLAGLSFANVIIPNNDIRTIWKDRKFSSVNPSARRPLPAPSGKVMPGSLSSADTSMRTSNS